MVDYHYLDASSIIPSTILGIINGAYRQQAQCQYRYLSLYWLRRDLLGVHCHHDREPPVFWHALHFRL